MLKPSLYASASSPVGGVRYIIPKIPKKTDTFKIEVTECELKVITYWRIAEEFKSQKELATSRIIFKKIISFFRAF